MNGLKRFDFGRFAVGRPENNHPIRDIDLPESRYHVDGILTADRAGNNHFELMIRICFLRAGQGNLFLFP
jgi:hypothetical protein